MSPPVSFLARYLLYLLKSDDCIASKLCRGHARDTDVLLTEHGVRKLHHLIETYKQKLQLTSNGDSIDFGRKKLY